MNYQKIYNSLTSKDMQSEYLETHHIIPRCMGGSDDPSNLVKLTAKAHFVAHMLLCKIYPDNIKLKFALNCMARSTKKQKRNLTASQYEIIKKENSIALSVLHSTRIRTEKEKQGISKALKGKKRSEETRKKCSEWQKGKSKQWQAGKKISEETKRKIGDANRGRKWTEEQRKNLSLVRKGKSGKFDRTEEYKENMRKVKKKNNLTSMNTMGYEILTPDGFKPFDGVAYSGLIPTLKFTLKDGRSIAVSKKHRFDSDKIASEYSIGEKLSGSVIVKIEDNGKQHCYDILEVPGEHLYIANGIVNHNCEIVKDEQLSVLPEVDDELLEQITKVYENPPFANRYVAMDIGFRDLTVVLYGFYDFRNDLIIIEDEIAVRGKDIHLPVFTQDLLNKEEELWTNPLTNELFQPDLRVSDINPFVIQEISRASGGKLAFSSASKDNKLANINKLRVMLANKKILINPKCKTLLRHLKNARWKDKGSKDDFARSPDDGHYDAVDALLYFTRAINYNKNPYPAGYGHNVRNMHIENRQKFMGQQHQLVYDAIFGVKKRR